MEGVLHVLERPSATARSLHSQQIEYAEPPRRGRRFECRASGVFFRTDQVQMEPQRVTDSSVWFQTAHTAYLLEQAPF
jgi:hypothetical protein